ncbi:hypothetical protein SS50377_20515 [Spironucleus salmonicida]|uniref:Uncharacterized protein n=1 Tax=Spironucleus salmonicida TaxID=348837 RepID=A0A9P8LZP1_9EUKA|nr:hypothetical protein SS50377_20515 [Spironucleus salmonicida]
MEIEQVIQILENVEKRINLTEPDSPDQIAQYVNQFPKDFLELDCVTQIQAVIQKLNDCASLTKTLIQEITKCNQ